jgi:hypothetical protein
LAWRSRADLGRSAAVLGLIAAIALVLGWIAPSLESARTSALAGLSSDLRMSFQRSADSQSCSGLLTVATLERSGPIGHPTAIVGGDLVGILGLAPRRTGTIAVVDALAATQAGVSDGDVATVRLKAAAVAGPIEVRPEPIVLAESTTGFVALNANDAAAREAVMAYGPAEGEVCVGPPGAPGIAPAEAIASRTSDGRVVNAGGLFAATAGAGWFAVTCLEVRAARRRRNGMQRLLRSYGCRAAAASVATYVDVVAVVLAASWVGAAAALFLRGAVLRMWTDGPIAAASVVGLGLLAGLAAVLVTLIDRQVWSRP